MTDTISREAAIQAVREHLPWLMSQADVERLLSALPAASGWMDISSAEIEGYEQNPDVLVYVPEVGQMIARYELDNDGTYDWFPMDQLCTIRPTHYMHLPPPPGTQRESENIGKPDA
ncbi:MAG: hypothetical protein ACRCVX_12575 [Shewanella sp.]